MATVEGKRSPAEGRDRKATCSKIDAASFVDPQLYETELERVFGRTWLIVGHEAMVPHAGDYVTNFMGEDPVVLTRDKNGKVHVWLNRCTHRGNKLCLFERGRATAMTCSFHGWTFGSSGDLVARPAAERYGEEFDPTEWGLVKPRVELHAGFVFANWDHDAEPLEAFLGDFRPYLEVLGETDLDGVEVLPGKHRFFVSSNWKILAENFAGDHYHVPSTHIGFFRVLPDPRESSDVTAFDAERYSVTTGVAGRAPHSFTASGVRPGHDKKLDELAARAGPDAVQWLQEYRERIAESGRDRLINDVGLTSVGNIFPNTAWAGVGSIGRLIQQFHPRGPHETECWAWSFVPRSAPEPLKKLIIDGMARRGTPAGMILPDDMENFARIDDAITSTVSRRFPLNYELGLGEPATPEGFREMDLAYLPGDVDVCWALTERNQRVFYDYWQHLMARE